MRHLDRQQLTELLAAPVFHLIGEVADEMHLEAYVVGGYVRDLFLERPSKDIDVVVVGSGIQVARQVAVRLGRHAHLSVFKNFGTAQVKDGALELEFVGACRESYSHDSRKPIVEDGTLEDDQQRRDFTINAMAVCLNRERFGELVDPFDGVTSQSNPSQRRSSIACAAAPGLSRGWSRSSMRMIILPPSERARSHAMANVRTLPRWSAPVGLGASLPT